VVADIKYVDTRFISMTELESNQASAPPAPRTGVKKVKTRSAVTRILAISLLATLLLLPIQACSPQNVKVSAEAPTTVAKGDRFEIRAKVLNTAHEKQVLCDLDIADEYLEGIVIEGTRPEFSEATHIPIDNTMSYSFDLPIDPGDEAVIVLSAYAAKRGDFAGEIDFCVNSEFNFLSYPVRTVVE
jgi:hypothetical protein